MSTVIDEYFNGNFHFVPPVCDGLKLEQALRTLHERIGKCLQLESGKSCVDIGCGIGGVIMDLESTEADITGVTIASNEVEIGNANFKEYGIYPRCQLIEGDCHHMPFEDSSKDAAYAIYALKYFVDLDPILKEVSRILKPKGLFVIYDLVKTEKYDENNAEHKKTIEGLEYACGMPSLHKRDEMIAKAKTSGLEYACGMPSLHKRDEMIEKAKTSGFNLKETIDLGEETGFPFYYCFTSSPLFMWMVESPIISTLIKIGQAIKILPSGFHRFNDTFLAGTVAKIVKGGQMGILSGAEIMVFEKL
uniref:SAM-dependent methyltransferase Erg6/SMT-type domain-containing protein n=1 Tax=Panagrolaimus sp. ES5 TaxID=591445 RepID=A0AC34GRP8_9BILA